jgi:peptidyl-tRNA hydrolase, PTH1 family
MLLLIGLGNPGQKYAQNRHNIGFMVLDAIQLLYRGTPWRSKFQGEASEVTIGGSKLLLLKPLTFMNESGRAVFEAMRFYKIEPGNVFVFHDELDLPPGKLRIKRGGGNAGHNGLRSISAHCGNEYPRIRLGIGHPGDKAKVHGYVLDDFPKAERGWVDDLCRIIAKEMMGLVAGDEAGFANRVHLAMAPHPVGANEQLNKRDAPLNAPAAPLMKNTRVDVEKT